jgi:hypothetical protein
MSPFSVSDYKELPILRPGWKLKQKRDAKGKFIKGFDEVPDPDYKMNQVTVSTVYLINMEKHEARTCKKCVYSIEKHYIDGKALVCVKIANAYDCMRIPEDDFYCKYWECKKDG